MRELGDGPVSPEYKDRMLAIMKVLDDTMNPGHRGKGRKVGIVVLMFPYGDDPKGRCNFMSNGADRGDLVKLFKAMIARFEGQPEMKGRA